MHVDQRTTWRGHPLTMGWTLAATATLTIMTAQLVSRETEATPKAVKARAHQLKPVPSSLSRAVGLRRPSGVSGAGLRSAERLLKRARAGHDFKRISLLRGEDKRFMPRTWRSATATLQLQQLLTKAPLTLVKPRRRRYLRSLYDHIAKIARKVWALPPQWTPGVAVVKVDQAPITSCLANGAIIISERLVANARDFTMSVDLSDDRKLLAMLGRSMMSVGRRRCEGKCGAPPRDAQRHAVDSTLAFTLGHELGHSLQDMVYSWPLKGWTDAENQERELEADAVGLWVGACAGHAVDVMAMEALIPAVMDAAVRPMGVREANYPPFETRAPGVYRTVAAIVAAHKAGDWPKGCAALDFNPKGLVPEAKVMPWLTRLSTKAGSAEISRQYRQALSSSAPVEDKRGR